MVPAASAIGWLGPHPKRAGSSGQHSQQDQAKARAQAKGKNWSASLVNALRAPDGLSWGRRRQTHLAQQTGAASQQQCQQQQRLRNERVEAVRPRLTYSGG